jgi:ABC-type nickel/cobalt efflux system permease component RcnA
MSALVLTYSTALLLGSLHAFEADHMAAVTSFAVRKPGLRDAVRFAVRWAVGHGGAIVLIGGGLLLLGVRVPESTEHLLERLVGVVMIGLGIWTFRSARALHAHTHGHDDGIEHAHVHAHPPAVAAQAASAHAHSRATHEHSHASTAVGLVHGLAGSGAAVALIPVVGFESPLRGILFLLIFALGTVAAMALYGLFAGVVVGRTADSSTRLARLLARGTGLFTIVVGCVWLLR